MLKVILGSNGGGGGGGGMPVTTNVKSVGSPDGQLLVLSKTLKSLFSGTLQMEQNVKLSMTLVFTALINFTHLAITTDSGKR